MCLRFAPDSPGEAGPQWSHPLELEKSLSSAARYISLPVRPAASSGAKDTPLLTWKGASLGWAPRALRAAQRQRGHTCRDLTTLQTAAAPAWDLQGLHPRIGRHIKHYSRYAPSRSFYGHARRDCFSKALAMPSIKPIRSCLFGLCIALKARQGPNAKRLIGLASRRSHKGIMCSYLGCGSRGSQ